MTSNIWGGGKDMAYLFLFFCDLKAASHVICGGSGRSLSHRNREDEAEVAGEVTMQAAVAMATIKCRRKFSSL